MKKVKVGKDKYALVNDEDYSILSQYTWRFTGRYVVRCQLKHEYIDPKKIKSIGMHTQIMQPPKGFVVDHIDGNSLNNQRKNLRIATSQQNNFNRRKNVAPGYSKYKGVTFFKKHKKWTASIKYNKIQKYLGSFEKEGDAARAYNEAAKKLFGEFAVKPS